MAFPPLCRSAEAERRRLWAAKLFAGRIRVRWRCLLSKIREKYLRRYLHMYRDVAGYFYGALSRLRYDEELELLFYLQVASSRTSNFDRSCVILRTCYEQYRFVDLSHLNPSLSTRKT